MSAGEGSGKQLLQTVQAIDRIFKARSVAVVGVSSDPAKLGYMTLESILKGGYDGRVYPVNPRGGELLGLKVYKSPASLPLSGCDSGSGEICARGPAEAAGQGIRAVKAAYFREAGGLLEEDPAIARETGLRFAGPNIQDQLPAQQAVLFSR